MNWANLHPDVQKHIKSISTIKARIKNIDLKTTPIIFSKSEYYDLFWILFRNQQRAEFRQKRIDLVEQLHTYISINRSLYETDFSILNPAKIIRPTPMARQSTLEGISTIERIDKFLVANLAASDEKAEFYLGRFLYSAMRFGGLLRDDLLCSLQTQLSNQSSLYFGTSIWFSLQGSIGDKHIWQPDCLTIQLINHWYKNGFKYPTEKKPISLVNAFIRQSSVKSVRGFSATWLFSAIAARLSLDIKPFALPVLLGTQTNITLKEHVFHRLISKKSPQLIEDKKGNPGVNEQNREIGLFKLAKQLCQFNFSQTKATLEQVKVILSEAKISGKQTRSEKSLHQRYVSGLIDSLLVKSTHLPPVVFYLLHWASIRLMSPSVWSDILGSSTVQTYLNNIALPMLMVFGDHDILVMSDNELEENYTLLIDDGKSSKVRKTRAGILRDFHIYLETYHHVPPCYVFASYIIKGRIDEPLSIDASILMPWEYTRAKDFLINSTKEQTGLTFIHVQAILLALILSFRCGLRRQETRFIRLQDIEVPTSDASETLPPSTTLFLTPHEDRSIKSTSGERRLPLGYLLDENEKKFFYNFLVERKKIGTEYSDYLFFFGHQPPLGAADRRTVQDDILMKPLTKLLQRITGDNLFRIHNLRHSFATWVFWSLARPADENTVPIETLRSLPEFVHLQRAKQELLHLKENQPTRKLLHFLSAMIGHAGPSMTLMHYIHSVSWVSWCELNLCSLKLNREAEACLAAVDVRTASRVRTQQQPDVSVYSGMAAYAALKVQKNSSPITFKHWRNANEILPGALNVPLTEGTLEIDIYTALLLCFNENVPRERCAKTLNIQQTKFDQACRNAEFFLAQNFNAESSNDDVKRPKNHKTVEYKYNQKIYIDPIPHLPNLPKKKRHLKISSRMTKKFKMLEPDKQFEVLWACEYIVTRCSASWPDFRFTAPHLMHRFVEAIQLLTPAFDAAKRLRFTLTSKAKLESEERLAQWQYWKLGSLPNAYQDNRYNKDYAPNGFMAVDYLAVEGNHSIRDEKRERRENLNPKKRRRLSEYGVRFGIYLIFCTHYRLS